MAENSDDNAFLDHIRRRLNNAQFNDAFSLAAMAVTGADSCGRPVSLQMNGNLLEVSADIPNTPAENGAVVNYRYVEISEAGRAGYAEVKNAIAILDSDLIHFMDAFEENFRPDIHEAAISEGLFEDMLKHHPRPRPGHCNLRRLRSNFAAFNLEYDFNRRFIDRVNSALFEGIPAANIRMLKTLTTQLERKDVAKYENWVDIVTGGNRRGYVLGALSF